MRFDMKNLAQILNGKIEQTQDDELTDQENSRYG